MTESRRRRRALLALLAALPIAMAAAVALGSVRLPIGSVLASLLSAAGLPEHPIRAWVNAFLILDEGRVFLVDTGMGHYAGPTMGHLSDSL